MKASTVAVLAAVGFGVYYFAGLGVAGNDLLVVFKGFQINNISNYTIVVTLQNVSNSTIQFNGLSATVYINGDTLGNLSYLSQQPISVPPNTQQDLPLTFNASLVTIGGAIKDLINNVNGPFTIEVKGNFNANNLPLPLDVSETITV